MNLPDKCPFCGAGVSATGDGSKRSERWVSFDCFTQVFAGDTHPTQSKSCNVSERASLAARVAELEARCRRLEEAARAVYIDSIASDHPWTELETRNMHALRDVLEAKP